LDLPEVVCWERVALAAHGVLGTRHPDRGVDLVPVVFAVDGHQVIIPVDTVKPKRTLRLQRLENLMSDPRCSLLVEHFDEDWSRLWWVRLSGRGAERPPSPTHLTRLAEQHTQYAQAGAVASTIVFTADAVTGWAASVA